MAKQRALPKPKAKPRGNPKYVPDLLPLGTIIEVVKIDKHGEFVGMKEMKYGDWKQMKRQPGFHYRAFQKGVSQFNK